MQVGFELQKKLKASADQKAFLQGLSADEKKELATYRKTVKDELQKFERSVAGKSAEEVRAIRDSLPPEMRTYIAYERKSNRSIPETNSIVEAQKEASKYVNEMHPDISSIDRFFIKNFVPRNAWASALKKKMPAGYDVIEKDNNVWVKGPNETQYRSIDPTSFEFADLSDLPVDIAQGVAEGLGAGAGGTAGVAAGLTTGPAAPVVSPTLGLAGAFAGGGAVGSTASALKQALAQKLGYIDDIDKKEIATEGVLSGAFSLLPGGRTVTKGNKDLLKGMKKTAYDGNLNKVKVPVTEKEIESMLYPMKNVSRETLDFVRTKLSGINERGLEYGRKYSDLIPKIRSASKIGENPLLNNVRDVRKYATEKVDEINKSVYAKAENLFKNDDKMFELAPFAEKIQKRIDAIQDTLKKDYEGQGAETLRESLKKLESLKSELPMKKGSLKLSEVDELDKRMNAIVTPSPTATSLEKQSYRQGMDLHKEFRDEVEKLAPGYRDYKAEYAIAKDFEDALDSHKMLESNLDKIKRAQVKEQGSKMSAAVGYTPEEAQALRNLTTHKPDLYTLLSDLDTKSSMLANPGMSEAETALAKQLRMENPGYLQESYDKLMGVKQWLPRERGSPLAGETRTGALTNMIATGALGSASVYAADNDPLMALPAIGLGLAMTPAGIRQQFRASKMLQDAANTELGRAALASQPLRVTGENIYETLRSKEK